MPWVRRDRHRRSRGWMRIPKPVLIGCVVVLGVLLALGIARSLMPRQQQGPRESEKESRAEFQKASLSCQAAIRDSLSDLSNPSFSEPTLGSDRWLIMFIVDSQDGGNAASRTRVLCHMKRIGSEWAVAQIVRSRAGDLR